MNLIFRESLASALIQVNGFYPLMTYPEELTHAVWGASKLFEVLQTISGACAPICQTGNLQYSSKFDTERSWCHKNPLQKKVVWHMQQQHVLPKMKPSHPEPFFGCWSGSVKPDQYHCCSGRPPGPQIRLLPASPTPPQNNLAHAGAHVQGHALGHKVVPQICSAAICATANTPPPPAHVHSSGYTLTVLLSEEI